MTYQIRPFTGSDSDYAAVIAVHNAVFPDHIETVDAWRHWDSSRPDNCLCDRWLAEEAGQTIGFGHAVQFPNMYHPQKFYVELRVLPASRRRGVGAQLYATIVGRLAERQPLALRTETRADMAAGLAFLAARGYAEEMRTWDSRLDVPSFDPAPFAARAGKAAAHGVTIVSLAEYMQREPNHRRLLHEALVELHRDVPRPDVYTPIPFDEWDRVYLDQPDLLPEGYFIALFQGQIAGMSQLWKSGSADTLYTGLTATGRNFRRMGIALALKLRAIAYAQSVGAREIRTGNESNNRGMISINDDLGFVKQPAWITFVKHSEEA
jgi:GNAT superfamily N-acetyltransferase